MTEHEMADWLDDFAAGLDPAEQLGSKAVADAAAMAQRLRDAARMLRAVPTRVQKILTQALLTNGRLRAAEQQIAVLKADAERASKVEAANHASRSLRLLGLDDQETP